MFKTKSFNFYFIEDWFAKQKKKLFKKIFKNFKSIFYSLKNFFRVCAAILIFLLLLQPMFSIGFYSGLFFILTFAYVFLLKIDIIIKSPTYSVLIFIVFAVRALLFPFLFKGIQDLEWGFWLEGATFLIAWVLIYFKTRSMQRH